MSNEPHSQETHRHPTEGTYFTIFIVLAVLTLVELMVVYIPVIKVPLLLGLAVTKAWLVVQFYMHLRYDSRIFTWVILLPTLIGLAVTLVVQPLSTIVR